MQRCAPVMGRHVLARLVQGGVGGIRGEMGQACFKALSMLFKSQVHVFGISASEASEASEEGGTGEGAGDIGGTGAGAGGGGGVGGRKRKAGNLFGLSPKQLRALLVVLQMAVAETEHQNATFTLIKAVVSRKVMLPEVRDYITNKNTVCCCCFHLPPVSGDFAELLLPRRLSEHYYVCRAACFCPALCFRTGMVVCCRRKDRKYTKLNT